MGMLSYSIREEHKNLRRFSVTKGVELKHISYNILFVKRIYEIWKNNYWKDSKASDFLEGQ